MTKLDTALRKEIVKNLHAAIDSEILNNDKSAYVYYIESLKLVSEALKQDVIHGSDLLTLKDRWNLIEFAKQSVARVSLILKKGEPDYGEVAAVPSAPIIQFVPFSPSHNSLPVNRSPGKTIDDDDRILSRYHNRLSNATTALEKQNLELEFARQLVEKATITRNRLMQATAWAMNNAHSKFHIQEKLENGTLKESDFRKQQLFALSLQFTEGSSWLKQCIHNLSLYPNNEKLVRELLDNILTDSTHPIKCTLYNMQLKVKQMIPQENLDEPESYIKLFTHISNEIKEDIYILLDVLKELFEPLKTEKNSHIAAELINQFYFAPIKTSLISLIRQGTKERETDFLRNIEQYKTEYVSTTNEDAKKEAITKLHYLPTLHNPYDMIDCSVHVVKLLTTSQFDKNHFTSIGADDLLPRLCEVVSRSRLVDLGAEMTFVEAFLPSDRALGEEGYAVTMLQSAIQHITSGAD